LLHFGEVENISCKQGVPMFKLIIADDEKTTREGLIHYIPWRELGVELMGEAEDGVMALDLALKIHPDIILTDVRMPKMNGIELAEHLKAQLPACKIIFLSGYSDKEYLKSAIQLQAVDYIEKPVDIEEVKTIIRKTIVICHAEQEKKRIENDLQDKVSESSFLLKEKFVLELLNTSQYSPDLSDKFMSLKLKYPTNDTLVVAVITLNSMDHESNFDIQIHRSSILEKIEAKFNEIFLHCISGFQGNNSIISLIYGATIEPLQIKAVFETIKDDIGQLSENSSQIFIGIGKSVKGIKNTVESYQTALMVVQKQFFAGYNQVKFYNPRPGHPYEFDSTLIKKFQDFIGSDKLNEAITLINRIADDISQYDDTPINLIKDFFFQIILALSKIAEERNMLIGEPAEQFSWNIISKSGTIAEIQAYIIKEVEQFFKIQEDRDHKSNVVCHIIKLVNRNYQNKNLAIKDLADQLFLTPNYLCLLFKKETGKTINQYITEIRIEKAKEFLKDRRTKLYEVAELVGYSDVNYFSKIFKKMVSLNPSEFREKYLL
jgi:two-component system, response regulator YesN